MHDKANNTSFRSFEFLQLFLLPRFYHSIEKRRNSLDLASERAKKKEEKKNLSERTRMRQKQKTNKQISRWICSYSAKHCYICVLYTQTRNPTAYSIWFQTCLCTICTVNTRVYHRCFLLLNSINLWKWRQYWQYANSTYPYISMHWTVWIILTVIEFIKCWFLNFCDIQSQPKRLCQYT